ncbi:polysaccharide deacetylase family protein [Carboxydothermus pertinax]|uniref:NodB homology domain-containing protein n=1 Tax=Carboxydothermus pertinax TaxID=870242 RepID=A0A1L8CT76_9THEO|nr:polysaccharide deacetylase family protein [Carboxydothermus pertinax]GAV22121.1 hypothetical protein cpu_06310 [Carboxydothermus pertinax]
MFNYQKKLYVLLVFIFLVFNLTFSLGAEKTAEPSAVPILMYHIIGKPSGSWPELYVQPEVFLKQLDWLKANGYHTVSLKDVYDYWYENKPLPSKPIVLTFDDGNISAYNIVLPALKERGMRATFFIITGSFQKPTAVKPEMVKQLYAAGMEIGSHTVNHLDLTKISRKQLAYELKQSKLTLEKLLNAPVEFFCYPSGRVNTQVEQEVRKYYLGAVTTRYGKASKSQNPYLWKRIRINGSDGLAGFITKIRGN